MGSRTQDECILHFLRLPIEDPYLEDPEHGAKGGIGGDGGPMGDLGADSNEPHEETAVTIPKDMAGAIIGPGGSRIRKIRADSKATITIAEPDQGPNSIEKNSQGWGRYFSNVSKIQIHEGLYLLYLSDLYLSDT